MILIGILTGVLILGIYLYKKSFEVLGGILMVIPSVLLFFALVTIPINRMSVYSSIEEYKAFKQTIETSREGGVLTNFERAAIQKDVAKWNQDLASVKYYNKYWDLWIPDEVSKLKPLE